MVQEVADIKWLKERALPKWKKGKTSKEKGAKDKVSMLIELVEESRYFESKRINER